MPRPKPDVPRRLVNLRMRGELYRRIEAEHHRRQADARAKGLDEEQVARAVTMTDTIERLIVEALDARGGTK